jgi:YggT family protein
VNIIGLVLYWALQVFVICLWGRFILDIARMARPDWRPRGGLLVLFSFVYGITDPPLKLVRRFVKPVRMGPIALDLAWTIVLIVAIILMSLAAGLARV